MLHAARRIKTVRQAGCGELPPGRALVLDANPFYHFLELVRGPALGQAPEPVSWIAVMGITVCGWAATLAMYRAYRWRVAYWV